MHLWSVAIFDLRLSGDDFYSLTPRQFQALQDRLREARLHEEFLNGINTASVVNHSMAQPKKPAKPSDYMPSLHDAVDQPKRQKRITLKRQFSALKGQLIGLPHNKDQ